MEALVEKAPLVNFGDDINIIATNGNVSVNAPGKSLGKGHMGEIVRVQNIQTKRIIVAEVSGDKEVKITF